MKTIYLLKNPEKNWSNILSTTTVLSINILILSIIIININIK